MDLAQLDYEAAKFWMSFIQLAGLVALFIYTHLTNKSKANSSAIESVKEDFDGLKSRVVAIESRLENAPTHQDISKVYDRLNDVAEELSNVSGQMRGALNQLSMVNQYLLNQKGGHGQ